jgi:hypothetical protein
MNEVLCMHKYFISLSMIFLLTVYTGTPLHASDLTLADSAAQYIAEKAAAGKKTRLALYPFTTETGETSGETKTFSTRIIEKLMTRGNFRIIDPDRVAAVVEEQEKGLTGLVDPATAPETGKLIGADALIFGISGKSTLSIRIVDAVTSEIIGATVRDSGMTSTVQLDDMKQADQKNTFLSGQIIRNLKQLAESKPMLFLHATANPEETNAFAAQFPGIARDMGRKEKLGDKQKLKIFEQRKIKLLEMRKTDTDLDKAIQDMRVKVLAILDKQKRR